MILGVEGVDGSGKSTVARIILRQVESAGIRVVILRAGAIPLPVMEDLDIRPGERQEVFWREIQNPALIEQCKRISESLQDHDCVLLDRTPLSYILGLARVCGQLVSGGLLNLAVAEIQGAIADLPKHNALLFVRRPLGDILRTLHERSKTAEGLSVFDRQLLANPELLGEVAQTLEDACATLQAVTIENDGTLDDLQVTVLRALPCLTGQVR
jgi:hypothetical protein